MSAMQSKALRNRSNFVLPVTSVADSVALAFTTAPRPLFPFLVLHIQSRRLANGFFACELPRESQNER